MKSSQKPQPNKANQNMNQFLQMSFLCMIFTKDPSIPLNNNIAPPSLLQASFTHDCTEPHLHKSHTMRTLGVINKLQPNGFVSLDMDIEMC